ncbi:TetR/AcrR family transcriptional regulator [Nonomuraea sp. JJY05]|uniref:TetR/AcrR family transcriptional regulator n=1 Tax=Nonomuraea sp. JJY05 TaxID=3350255 RepID=UPI00373E7509
MENRARLLAAAREVFVERGLNVTLDEIAHHAGVGIATMYRNFPSRSALVDAVYGERDEQLDRILEEALAQEDSWDGLVLYLERMNTFIDADRGLRAVVMTTPEGAEAFAEGRVRRSARVEELIARAKEDGYLRRDAERSDLFLIDVMVDAVRDYTANVDAEQWRRCMAVLLDGLQARPEQVPLPGAALTRDEVAAAMKDVGRRRSIGQRPG